MRNKRIMIFVFVVLLLFLLFVFGLFAFSYSSVKFINIEDEEILVFDKYVFKEPLVCSGFNSKCKRVSFTREGDVNTSKIGVYKIVYKIDYLDDVKTIVKKISVVDKTKPVINIPRGPVKVCPNGTALNAKITAKDNYDGDLTKNIKTDVIGKDVLYSVSDSSSNSTTVSVKPIFDDDVDPVVTLKGNKKDYVKLGKKYKEFGALAYDICDGDITSNVLVSGFVDTSKPGVYKLKYSVSDKVGNTDFAIREVVVAKRFKKQYPASKTIYLTFDDGPGEYTGLLLDILKKYDVKATFFVTGNLRKYPEFVKRAFDEGHSIGLHTWSHDYSIYKKQRTYFYDLYKIEKEVEKLIGEKPTIIRFPGGSSNTVSMSYNLGIMSKLVKEIRSRGYSYYDWNVSSGDAGETTNTKKIIKNVTRNLDFRMNMVLQHDIYKYSVDAVPAIIEYGKKHGYEFSGITDVTMEVQHNVNN